MSYPLLSVIIPTYNRPHLLPRAVNTALAQTLADIEVIVVDDASDKPVNLPTDSRLKIIRLPKNMGTAVARNIGAKTARGRWITYLDDDDELLPHMAKVSIEALANTTLPKPVAVLSALEVVNQDGKVLNRRIPPTLPRGSHFFLEEIEPELSFFSKQTLVVEREVFLNIGGYDEYFTSRVHTEMFLRLNPICSILGLPTVSYRLYVHNGPRISQNPGLRQVNFQRLVSKHQSLLLHHPQAFGKFLYEHALRSWEMGQNCAAVSTLLWAMQLAPKDTYLLIISHYKNKFLGYIYQAIAKSPNKNNSDFYSSENNEN
ncbi:glycosyltransferase family 2 protein [Umezakia ovalisporum]|uniref:Glycosyltransferase n=2 Tax=Umezakia ovalisporum TaxID=75695 RepID=A0AA43H128_9CYAN|nr:glycosyltransferase family 2 protein [Umezakia ovalisporum]MDH6058627.1 glycosyltransferase [Umezakia ovalisporum FSS-43]MDH6065479.1 glycosyltransferase [Umezakia ovalisporum FSS-62]MDH6066310.1 glycosyltransferase [Umezakia ovalisporum APH033B]MDH6069810.1 glycosyltransferase [Umezakia ovalisporum CobakiLakeA]MDH6076709.1 glycosyltransferase [Umezakia ovalisporum FSS-45]